MNPKRDSGTLRAFTRIELLATLAVLALLAAVAWPVLAATRPRSQRVECISNLRRIGQAFQVWASDHGEWFPWKVPVAEGGVQELMWTASPTPCFIAISNELRTPTMLVCPTDGAKSKANRFDASVISPTDANVSYFVGTDAVPSQGRTWLSGDRNITIGNLTGTPGLLVIPPNSDLRWGATLHAYSGNLLLTDGSVHALTQADLVKAAVAAATQDPDGAIEILKP